MSDAQSTPREPEWPGFVFAVCAVTVVIAWALFLSWLVEALSGR